MELGTIGILSSLLYFRCHFSEFCPYTKHPILVRFELLKRFEPIEPILFLWLPAAAKRSVELHHAVQLGPTDAREFNLGVKEILICDQNF